MDRDKIKSIIDRHAPNYVIDVRSFMGIIGYYRKFIEGFQKIANPITSLQKKGKKIVRDQRCKDSFNKLKGLLATALII